MDQENLGQSLLSKGLISEEQLDEALSRAKRGRLSLSQVLIEMGFVTKEEAYSIIAEEIDVPYVDMSNYIVDPKVINLIDGEDATQHLIYPLFKIENTLTIAMADPTNLAAIDKVRMKTNLEIEACLATEDDIREAIRGSYEKGDAALALIEDVEELIKISPESLTEVATSTPVSKLVDIILTQAARDGASDIHIEPDEDSLRIRFRIDGILYEVPSPPKHLELAIISRLKVLSNLDIATTRIPQDGHFKKRLEGKEIDCRISTVPTIYGENLVIRVLNPATALLGLDELGFSPEMLTRFEEIISQPWGTVLVTGPTGSGKTTTLYAALNRINTVEKNIVTIEDPVEYRLGLIRQIQANPKAGLTFVNGLRSIVRQDPDVIMIGEIRDHETADIASQAALTGHLVFSTLHTNDAPGAVIRLVNMGIEPFLIAGSVIGVVAQRLVRRICSRCKESYKPSRVLLRRLGLEENKSYLFHRGRGCKECKETGYKGRAGLFELLRVSDEIRELIIKGISSTAIRKKAEKEGMKPLREDGISKILQGVTTIEEVTRVTQMTADMMAPMEVSQEEKVEAKKEEIKERKIITEEKAPSANWGRALNLNEYENKITSWIAKER
ncbi:MAG: ATPase, T2SS/T4P/T4SS family [bacterium]|nr:ATPase, T2SS/T4P/T4SS family [bacterium]